MKKITVLTIALFAALGAFAQFNQGRMLVGGDLGFTSTTDKTKVGNTSVTHSNHTTFTLTPRFGYFVVDRLAVGASVSLQLEKDKSKINDDVDNSTGFLFSPFVRYYLKPGIFFQGEGGIGGGKTKYTDNNGSSESKYALSHWALSAGYAWFLNDNVAIEPMLGYGSAYSKYKDSNPSYKEITPAFFIKVGFQIYLGK